MEDSAGHSRFGSMGNAEGVKPGSYDDPAIMEFSGYIPRLGRDLITACGKMALQQCCLTCRCLCAPAENVAILLRLKRSLVKDVYVYTL